MTILLLVLNIFCGILNTFVADSNFNRIIGSLNWACAGFLIAKMLVGL